MRAEKGTRKYRAFRALAAMGIAAILWLTMMYALSVSNAQVFQWNGPCISPTATILQSNITNGVQIYIVTISNVEVPWSLFKVQLTDDTNFAEWNPRTEDLDDGSPVLVNLTSTGATALGSIAVYCNVFDATGNGFVSGSDYIRVFTATGATTFISATNYMLVLIYEPTGGVMGNEISFAGES